MAENRPRNDLHWREFLISDEMDNLCFVANDTIQARPKKGISFVQHLRADDFSPASYTQGGVSDRSSRNYALG